jgi:hypothetical protein
MTLSMSHLSGKPIMQFHVLRMLNVSAYLKLETFSRKECEVKSFFYFSFIHLLEMSLASYPTFLILHFFQIFTVKLGHFMVETIFNMYLTYLQF